MRLPWRTPGLPPVNDAACLPLSIPCLRPLPIDRHRWIIEERMKQPHSIGTATDCCDQTVGQSAFGFHHLFAGFDSDYGLEFPHHFGIGVGASDRANNIECVLNIGKPNRAGLRSLHPSGCDCRTGQPPPRPPAVSCEKHWAVAVRYRRLPYRWCRAD